MGVKVSFTLYGKKQAEVVWECEAKKDILA
jgi:hypothetical protein